MTDAATHLESDMMKLHERFDTASMKRGVVVNGQVRRRFSGVQI